MARYKNEWHIWNRGGYSLVRSLEIPLHPSFSTFCFWFIFSSSFFFFYSTFFGPIFGSQRQRGDVDLHDSHGYWQGSRVRSNVYFPMNFVRIENLINYINKTYQASKQIYSFIFNTKAKILNLFKNFGEDKSVRNSSRCPLIKILGTPVETLTADGLKKKWIRIQPTQKMVLCTCSNKRTDNFCNYTARYILGIHQSYSFRKNPNTFIHLMFIGPCILW